MRISQLKFGILLSMPFILLMGFSSCERINPNNSPREEVAGDLALVTTELGSILEYFDEAADQPRARAPQRILKPKILARKPKF